MQFSTHASRETDRQIDRRTDTLISILRTLPTGKVKKLNRLHYQLFEQINKCTYTLKMITSSQDGCKYYDGRVCMYVCLSVCLSARISQRRHIQTSRNFLYMMPVAVVRSSSDDNAIRYVLPASCTTSCFHIMEQIQIQANGELFTLTRQVAPLNCASETKPAIIDCLLEKLVGTLQRTRNVGQCPT